MFKAPESMLSSHVAPGASQVTFAPFSFAWFARTEVTTSVAPDVERLDDVEAALGEALYRLEEDDLVGGREKLSLAIELVHSLRGGE
ncbi:hypothetical protein [Aporhodopirellula aestuarii]|uniref:Uncharacterized protein n=1 Tax=Aporhodopirellula aestuarii TaxID=2950107 RepID=A0ABT0TZH7_9BACT|nr:hypothetical protein [Aporhodopirellula aestuarii]MCM2369638.1 hypothetical protein [Aporhodopirellula aestuarii]